jgi:hypothetical protein
MSDVTEIVDRDLTREELLALASELDDTWDAYALGCLNGCVSDATRRRLWALQDKLRDEVEIAAIPEDTRSTEQ